MDRQDVPAAFDSAAATHVGKVRDRNEDYYLVQPQTGIWAVADGMGGGEIGDIASSSVIAELRTIAPPKSASDLLASCEERITTANSRLIALAENYGADTIIATTVAVLLILENYYACIRSGGSRIYCIRDGNITQLSRDHTEVQSLVAKGVLKPEEERRWPGNNVITRATGASNQTELEIEHSLLQSGDIFVICSDGLTVHLLDEEILECVGARGSQDACNLLIDRTLERGAVDNVTVVVVRYCRDESMLKSPVPGAASLRA